MANIIVCFWSENGKAFYDNLSDYLKQNGNNILYLNMHNYITYSVWGTKYDIVNSDDLWNRVSSFRPDVILSFNNVFPNEFADKLDCPVCILDADTPDVGFWHRDKLKENADRYVFLGFQSASRDLYTKAFGHIKNFLYFPGATTMVAEKLPVDKNISFIGSNFLYLRVMLGEFKFVDDKDLFYDALKVYKIVRSQNETELKNLYENPLRNNSEYTDKLIVFASKQIAGMDRIRCLQVLSDMGLQVYGLDTWRELAYYDLDLALCYDETPITSLEENQYIYNTSKIAVNISHPQAKSAFSWRVMDIMATNACLLMEEKPDFDELFGKYISKEVHDAIIYHDEYDLRTKAKFLLENENFRKRCVKECQNAIEQNGRWKNRFKDLGDFLGMNFLSNNSMGKIVYVDYDTVASEVSESFYVRHIKPRWKLLVYLMLGTIYNLPPINFAVPKKARKRMLDRITTYGKKV